MKSIKNLSGYSLLFAAVLFIVIYAILQVPAHEGFNPSDDGVILGQAYRLLHGQIPHQDFISIRPVGSAVIHSINFFSFLPLEISARWLTMIEYMIYSFIWTLLFVRCWENRYTLTYIIVPVLLGSWVFILNQNHYNLFPWTTIDALSLFSVALYLHLLPDKGNENRPAGWFKLIMISFFTVSASLCRQSFVLPMLILLTVDMVKALREKYFLKSLIAFITGAIPAWIYLVSLFKHNALKVFLSQMSGRTEIWQTGFEKFDSEFWHSPVLVLYIAVIIFILYQKLAQKNIYIIDRILRQGAWLDMIILVSSVLLGFLIFITPGQIFRLSFSLFWLLLLSVLVSFFRSKTDRLAIKYSLWIILLAWTSAISLGDNAPVFTAGLLIGGVFINTLPHISAERFILPSVWNMRYIILSLISLIFIIIGINGQMQNNYRDLAAGDLQYSLEKEYPEMGSLVTNQRTYAYLQDIRRIYDELGKPRGRFVVLPNGSLIYPLLESPNPFPLDWMQEPEFVGQDSLVSAKIREVVNMKEIYLLIDKYNTKFIADTMMVMEYDKIVYPYYEEMINTTKKVDVQSKWFELRKSQ